MIPDVTAFFPLDFIADATQDDRVLDARRVFDGVVGDLLELDLAAAPPALVLRDDHFAFLIEDAVTQTVCGETAEDDGVDRADARACEQRDGQLGHHAHVDRDTIALLHAERLEAVGEAARLFEHVFEGQRARVAGLAFPEVGDLLAVAALHMAVEAVIADVEGAAVEPTRDFRFLIPLQHAVPFGEPIEALGL